MVEDTVFLEESFEDDQGNNANCSNYQAGNAWCRIPCVLVSTPAYTNKLQYERIQPGLLYPYQIKAIMRGRIPMMNNKAPIQSNLYIC
jgi:hypothetical protein